MALSLLISWKCFGRLTTNSTIFWTESRKINNVWILAHTSIAPEFTHNIADAVHTFFCIKEWTIFHASK